MPGRPRFRKIPAVFPESRPSFDDKVQRSFEVFFVPHLPTQRPVANSVYAAVGRGVLCLFLNKMLFLLSVPPLGADGLSYDPINSLSSPGTDR